MHAAGSVALAPLDGWPFRAYCISRDPHPKAHTMTQDFRWTGTHVSGSTACAVVKYHGPTNTKGSRWIASIRRDRETVWRGVVSFQDGPIAAALTACVKAGVDWAPVSCHNIDADTYCVGF